MLETRADMLNQDRHRRPLLKRGAVSATLDPLEVLWNDRRVALSPLEATLLVTLLRRSRLRWHDAEEVLTRNGGCPDSRDVLIHRIRRKFADVGAGDPIETLRGWGIRFRTEADRQGSQSLWIGATDSAGDAA